jgi:hypothetical protein
VQDHTSDAEDILQFRYSQDQRFILLKFRRKVPLKKLRSLSLKRGTMTVLKLTEGIGLTEAGI